MMICLKNGDTEYVYDLDGMLRLIEERLGVDARRWLDAYLRERDADEAEFRENCRETMEELRGCAERLSGLVMEEDPDIGGITAEAAKIGEITGREIRG